MRRKVFIYFLSAFLLFTVFIATPKITSFRYNSLGVLMAGILPSWQKNQPLIPSEEIQEPSFPQEENANPGAGQELLAEKIDDLEDQIDVLSQRISEIEKQLQLLNEQVLIAQEEEEDVEEELEEDELAEEEAGQKVGQEPCEKIQGVQPAKNKIIFNEIAWMGTSASSSAEWIELKNISGKPLDLSGWQILDKDQEIKVIFSDKNYRGLTPVNGFLLLERTSDDMVPGIKADLIYTGTLSNANESLYLFDKNCLLQDEVMAGPDWPAGDNSSKRTMERKNDLSWQTSFNIGGTPKAENSSGYVVAPPPGGGGGGGGGGAPPPVPQPAKVVVNEIMYDLEGSDDGREWIEIFNIDAKNADLTGWTLYENETNHKLDLVKGAVNPAPLDFAVIVDNAEKFLTDYPDFSGNLFDSAFSLSNTDENVAIKAGNEIIDQVNYNSSWGANGGGNSLQRVSPEEDSNNSQNWQAALPTPGAENYFPQTDATPPVRTDGLPTGTLSVGATETDISLTTDEIAACKYSINPDQDYDLMTDAFLTTNGTFHSALITGLTDGASYNYYVRCVDTAGNKNTDDFIVAFSVALPPAVNNLVINEIYYDVKSPEKGNEPQNEWIEIYNPNNVPIDISGWKIEDNQEASHQRTISSSPPILANGFAVIAPDPSTWDYWSIPDSAIKISLGQSIGNGLHNQGDRVILKNPDGIEIDAMSYGTDAYAFTPACPDVVTGHSLAREPKGYDTNQPSDWVDLIDPSPGY